MKNNAQRGFTMIELIVVIVILGILAATALPKFIDMRADAKNASVAGIAGAAASAMNLNYAGCALTNHVVTANKCVQVASCDASTMMQAGLPAGLVWSGTAPAANAASATCTVALASGESATFTALGAGN